MWVKTDKSNLPHPIRPTVEPYKIDPNIRYKAVAIMPDGSKIDSNVTWQTKMDANAAIGAVYETNEAGDPGIFAFNAPFDDDIKVEVWRNYVTLNIVEIKV